MPGSNRSLRLSVSLSPRVARRVRALAKTKKASASHVIAELVETGLDALDRAREHFLALADRLTRATEPEEQKRLKDYLVRLTFGD